MHIKKASIFIILFLTAALCGCGKKYKNIIMEESSYKVSQSYFVSLSCEKKGDKLKFVTYNNFDYELCSGFGLTIEKKIDGVWYRTEIPPPPGTERGYLDTGWIIDSHSSSIETASSMYDTLDYENYSPGEYRAIKQAHLNFAHAKDIFVACEFQID